MKGTKDESAKFEYLPPPPDMRSNLLDTSEETSGEKFMRKFKEQPLIPIGVCIELTINM